ncbi:MULTISPECIES: phage portal protein [Methylosinus]|nr:MULTISPECIES: phage portal protein [Methylosinus]
MLDSLKSLVLKAFNVPLSSPMALDVFGVPASGSGLYVDALAALRVPAVAAGVKLISEAVATLDAHLVRETSTGRETIAPTDHPAARVLERPVPWLGESEWKRQIVADALLWGDGLALVNRVRGEPRELPRIDPRSCNIIVDMVTGEPSYTVALQQGGSETFTYKDVVHLRGQTLDGAKGLGLVSLGAEAIGLALVLEGHATRLFSRGARPGGVLEMPTKIHPDVMSRLRESFAQVYQGTHNSGKTAILEQGVKFTPLQLSSVDAQFLELRKFQTLEIARLLNIPAVLLNDLEHATLNNSAALAQLFLDRTISPILELFEDALERTLLTDEERDGGYCIEFCTNNFVRVDLDKRFAALKTGIESGVLTLNEARQREGLPPVEGGDKPMRSVQVLPLDAASAPQPQTTEPTL